MKKFVRLPVLLVAVVGLVPQALAERPNIVFFFVDDMGWQDTSEPFHTETTRLNEEYETPAMERLADQGLKFTQAYANAVCTPSRVSLMTGQNAARHRVTNWTLRKDTSPDKVHPELEPPRWNVNGLSPEPGIERTVYAKTLPMYLNDAGYRTIHAGKAHWGARETPGEDPLNLGFDINIAGHAAGQPGSYLGTNNFSAAWRGKDDTWDVPGMDAYHGQDIYLTEAITIEALKAVDRAVADGVPFYLYMSHYAIHAPHEADDRYQEHFVEKGLSEFDSRYASMIAGMDKSLGDVMARLEHHGIADDTVIIFMTDNGQQKKAAPNLPLRGHKLMPYEGGIRVPALVKWPGVTQAGAISTTPIIIEDIFPTILDIAGVKDYESLDGQSFVPLLRGESVDVSERALVWHFPHTYDQPAYSAIRRGDWKLIYWHVDQRFELFDLATDIGESNDLAETRSEVVQDLAQTLGATLKARDAQMPVLKSTGEAVPLPGVAAAGRASAAERPNIVVLLSDDQGYGDVGRHGHPFLKTPNMDLLYDQSVRLTDFSVSPTCSPTRAALMTGMQELNSGVTHTLLPRRLMNRAVTTLPQVLGQAGYNTAMFGKWHLGLADGYRPHQRGFDTALTVPGDHQKSHYDPQLEFNGAPVSIKGYRTDIFFDQAMDWIAGSKGKPFFLYIPTFNAHSPLIVPDEYAAPYRKHVDEKTANYFGMLANLDENLGRLLAHLETLGLADNTLVVFMSDNGGTFGVDTYNAGMRGVKGTVWRGGTRALSFWRWPGHLEPRDEAVMTGHIDLLPTLADIAGAKLPEAVAGSIEGISLADRLENPASILPDRMLFQHSTRWGDGLADEHRHVNASVRWGDWHLLRSGPCELDDCMGSCRVFRAAEAGGPMLYTQQPGEHYRQTVRGRWSLYRLSTDAGEDHDLAGDYPEVVAQMGEAYEAWWTKVRPSLINEKNGT